MTVCFPILADLFSLKGTVLAKQPQKLRTVGAGFSPLSLCKGSVKKKGEETLVAAVAASSPVYLAVPMKDMISVEEIPHLSCGRLLPLR